MHRQYLRSDAIRERGIERIVWINLLVISNGRIQRMITILDLSDADTVAWAG